MLAADVFPGNGKLASPDEELRRLHREVEVLKQEREPPKKSGGVLREGVTVKYACIRQHRGEFAVRLMCRALGVSPSGSQLAKQASTGNLRLMNDTPRAQHARGPR